MAWTEGDVNLPGNFHNSAPAPLDGKTVVPLPADLATITAPFKGLVVHVADNDAKTYVCVDEDVSGSVPGGVPDPAVWKELGAGGGSSTTVTLEDESSAPTGAADKVILYSANEKFAESQPDHLYLFNEVASEDDAIDSGRDGTGNTGLKVSTSGVNYTGGEYISGFGNSAIFASGNTPSIRVGGTSAPYWMSGKLADVYSQGQGATARGDFEIQFLFSIENGSLDQTHTLLSVDPSLHQIDVQGFYSVLLVASSSSGGSSVVFEYFDDTVGKLETIEWTVPGTLVTASTGHYHIAISFFENDRGTDTTDINPSAGKFRCYLDGVVLEDKNAAGALSVSGQFEELGRASSSPYTLHPLYLGQYLDGSSAAPVGDNLYHLDSNENDAIGSNTAGFDGSPNTGSQYVTSTAGAGFGQMARISNVNSNGGHVFNVPDPGVTTGALTIEFFFSTSDTSSSERTIFSSGEAMQQKHNFRVYCKPQWGHFAYYAQNATTLNTPVENILWILPSYSTMRHYALVRSAVVNGRSTLDLYVDGTRQTRYSSTTNDDSVAAPDLTGEAVYFGARKNYNTSGYRYCLIDGVFDEIRITKAAVYSGASFTVPTEPFSTPAYDPATMYFEGQMHEFSVYNHRCLHNTSDKFERPTAPTRSTPLSVANIADSEDTHSPILTASNLGMLLPKSIEGLADGSAWNDKGIVKIAPLTGDLDEDVATSGTSFVAQSAPAAESGVAKIYAKSVTSLGDALYNFTSGDPTADDIRVGNAGSFIGSPNTGGPYVTNHLSVGAAFGDQVRISNVTGAGTPAAPGHLFKIPDHGIGAGDYTIEFFYDPADIHSNGAGVFCLGYDTWGTLFDVSLKTGAPTTLKYVQVRDVDATLARTTTYEYHWPADAGTMKHWAISREVNAPGPGYSRITIYIDGRELPLAATNAHVPGNVYDSIVNYNHSYNEHLFLGGWRESSSSFPRAIEAFYDSVLITHACKYPAGSPPNPVPTAPFGPPSGTVKLFAMDSAGNETQLTP